MSTLHIPRLYFTRRIFLALALLAGAGLGTDALAQPFPQLRVWAFPGAYQDSSVIRPGKCIGLFQGPLPDSIQQRPRTISVRFLRSRVAEARLEFGGYRIYRMTNIADTTTAQLIRRFSLNQGDDRTWSFSRVDTTTLEFKCKGQVVHDSIVTFIDSDSAGNFKKECRVLDRFGRCLSIGDSVIRLITPPGPHDGIRTWYSITYEERNSSGNDYQDLYVPGRDTFDNFARCGVPGDSATCPIINLNHKQLNVSNGTADNPFVGPVEPTRGPSADLERVRVVPNPYRGQEAWDQPGQNEVHFINLPPNAKIRIFTASGDLVTTIDHNDSVRDFARWDLRNGSGKDVASGIYMYRVEAERFQFQHRFVVIR